jgi:hypothetical protein
MTRAEAVAQLSKVEQGVALQLALMYSNKPDDFDSIFGELIAVWPEIRESLETASC